MSLFCLPNSQGFLIIQDICILRVLTVVQKSKYKGYSGIQGMDNIKKNRCLGDYNGTEPTFPIEKAGMRAQEGRAGPM